MKRALLLSLAALTLCGFGAGPFWGENKGTGAAAPALALSDWDYCAADNLSAGSVTCSYDAGTGAGRGLIVGFCASISSASGHPISGSTVMTYNGVSMTQIAFVQSASLQSGQISAAIYYLNNPAEGVNDIFTDLDQPGNLVTNYVVSAARVAGHAPTQSGPTDTFESGSANTLPNTISGHAADDLLYHFGCISFWEATLTSDVLTSAQTGNTGGGGIYTSAFMVATGTDASPTTNTLTPSTGNRRATSILFAIEKAP